MPTLREKHFCPLIKDHKKVPSHSILHLYQHVIKYWLVSNRKIREAINDSVCRLVQFSHAKRISQEIYIEELNVNH